MCWLRLALKVNVFIQMLQSYFTFWWMLSLWVFRLLLQVASYGHWSQLYLIFSCSDLLCFLRLPLCENFLSQDEHLNFTEKSGSWLWEWIVKLDLLRVLNGQVRHWWKTSMWADWTWVFNLYLLLNFSPQILQLCLMISVETGIFGLKPWRMSNCYRRSIRTKMKAVKLRTINFTSLWLWLRYEVKSRDYSPQVSWDPALASQEE